MKKIKDLRISQEHLMASLIHSLLYWLSEDLNNFITSNDEKTVLKKILEVCKRKTDIHKLLSILNELDPYIKCKVERKKLKLYGDFAYKTAKKVIEKSIIDLRSEDIVQTEQKELEDQEVAFFKVYNEYLEDNDPGKISVELFNKLGNAFETLAALEPDNESYNDEVFKKFKNDIQKIKSDILNLNTNEVYSNFLIDEIVRVDCKDKESIKSWLAENVIALWKDIFNKVVIYCDRLLEASEDNDIEKILDCANEMEWINHAMMYASFYIMKDYFNLTEYKWTSVTILSCPGSDWDEVI